MAIAMIGAPQDAEPGFSIGIGISTFYLPISYDDDLGFRAPQQSRYMAPIPIPYFRDEHISGVRRALRGFHLDIYTEAGTRGPAQGGGMALRSGWPSSRLKLYLTGCDSAPQYCWLPELCGS